MKTLALAGLLLLQDASTIVNMMGPVANDPDLAGEYSYNESPRKKNYTHFVCYHNRYMSEGSQEVYICYRDKR